MRLRAFTILEMMVGMAIAALVVSIGFYGLQLVNQQFGLFRKNSDIALNHRHLEALLWHDFSTAQWVEHLSDSSLLCTTGQSLLRYRFLDSMVLRIQAAPEPAFTDTLRLFARPGNFRLDSQPIQQGLLDHCTFTVRPYGESSVFSVTKIYSAADRIAYEQQHEH